jgi:DNA-binding transcriptional LysR family regulator
VDLNRVDLNLLVAFDALMAERSVTRAAERLCVGQSAMSSTLARLRRLLDDPVLVREGRGLVATPFAESLVKPVRDALDGVEAILESRTRFDPVRAERTFTVIASDYTMFMLLTPLLARLAEEAPGVRLWVSPPGEDYVARLQRGQVDLVIMPREVFTQHREFPHRFLFQDRFVCAVDADNDAVGETITLEEFSSLPYLATSCGHEISPAEAQLDLLGIVRNVEITTAFGLAPMLLSGTQRIALIHERLAWAMADQASLRLLEPPMQLQPINQLMLWRSHAEADPGHRWLRSRVLAFAEELELFGGHPARVENQASLI